MLRPATAVCRPYRCPISMTCCILVMLDANVVTTTRPGAHHDPSRESDTADSGGVKPGAVDPNAVREQRENALITQGPKVLEVRPSVG